MDSITNDHASLPRIGPHAFEEYIHMAEQFHGYAAPGLILGGFMVAEVRRRLPESILYDAISETAWCMPDAIQMLTPCTIGNGWLKVFNLGLYALCLYDKATGEGVRAAVDPSRIGPYPAIGEWLYKLKPKKEQDSARLREEMRLAGHTICDFRRITVKPDVMRPRGKGHIGTCRNCGQPYPCRDGAVCRACQGESPYDDFLAAREERFPEGPKLRVMEAGEAIGKTLLHDMTGIEPGRSKGAVFKRKQRVEVEDVCQLQRLGRYSVYVEEGQRLDPDWIHEDEAARAMAGTLAGDGVDIAPEVREGKAVLRAGMDGLLLVDVVGLERFNRTPGVICASRQTGSLVNAGQEVAAARAIPLYLEREQLERAVESLDGPAVRVAALRPRGVGVLVTGTEVFQGLVNDRFAPIVRAKVEAMGCRVVATEIAPDDRNCIAGAVRSMLERGAELIVTTAGLSVDPEDVTRKGLEDAGARDMLYGLPVLPGAMSLVAKVEESRIIGVPACALYFRTTGFDVLLPRVLADLEITRSDLAALGHGGLCHNCKNCTYPKCGFAK
ncbi:FmdE family protein [Desulfohalovibrio reitneri]|uniref:FmdE family protein n=1 Tax=Desulfohalovibrio reitneri TaxID=1307759 RepID=UPI00068F87CA|nr:FmdE family protein [Desulfohalovibrio reitneri]